MQVQEILIKDSVGIVASLVSTGTSGSWVVDYLEYAGIDLPRDLRARIACGMTTTKDADSIIKIMQAH